MGCYKINLNCELEIRYQCIAIQLGMTVEQVLYAVVQIYSDCLPADTTVTAEDVARVRAYEDRCMGRL